MSTSLNNLFGGFSSSFNFSDYASLRNGSYYKLLKAHYAKNTDSASSSAKKTERTYNYWDYNEKIKKQLSGTSYSKDSAETLSSIQKSASGLSSAAKTLSDSGKNSVFSGETTTDENGSERTKYDTDAIYKAVSSYVKEYNNLVQNTSSSQVGAINASRSSILSYTKANSSTLNSLGITINSKDNTLSIDEDKFKRADMDAAKKLFQGSNSYAARVGSAASAIESHAKYEASRVGTNSGTNAASSTNSTSKTYNYWNYNDAIKNNVNTSTSWDSAGTISAIQTDSADLSNSIKPLTSTSSNSLLEGTTTTDADGNKSTQYDTDKIYKALSSYVKDYNSLIESSGKSSVGGIAARRASMLGNTNANAELLDSIGIKINSKDKSLSIDENKFKSADMDTVKKLFQGKDSYASKISEAASAINSHAKYESTKSNTYNNFGSYSSNYASSWSNMI